MKTSTAPKLREPEYQNEWVRPFLNWYSVSKLSTDGWTHWGNKEGEHGQKYQSSDDSEIVLCFRLIVTPTDDSEIALCFRLI